MEHLKMLVCMKFKTTMCNKFKDLKKPILLGPYLNATLSLGESALTIMFFRIAAYIYYLNYY